MINQTLKELLLDDVEKANSVDELKIILTRLISGIPTNQDIANKILNNIRTIGK